MYKELLAEINERRQTIETQTDKITVNKLMKGYVLNINKHHSIVFLNLTSLMKYMQAFNAGLQYAGL